MNGPQAMAFLMIFVGAFVIMPALAIRYRRLQLRHEERLIAIQKGIALPQAQPESVTPQLETYLLRGLVWLAGGIGITLMLLLIMPMIILRNPYDVAVREDQLRRLDYSKQEIRDAIISERDSLEWRSRGLAALGLPPIAVGIAYLVFYQEQKRRRLANPSV